MLNLFHTHEISCSSLGSFRGGKVEKGLMMLRVEHLEVRKLGNQ